MGSARVNQDEPVPTATTTTPHLYAHFHDATRGNGEEILLSFPLPTPVVGQQLTGLGIVHTLGTDSTVFTIQDYTAMSEVRAWGATFRE